MMGKWACGMLNRLLVYGKREIAMLMRDKRLNKPVLVRSYVIETTTVKCDACTVAKRGYVIDDCRHHGYQRSCLVSDAKSNISTLESSRD